MVADRIDTQARLSRGRRSLVCAGGALASLVLSACAADGATSIDRDRASGHPGSRAGGSGAGGADVSGTSGVGGTGSALPSGGGSAVPPGSGGAGLGGGTMVQEMCDTPGETRSCCNGGTQTCAVTLEFGTWGPCLDASGNVVDCSDPCATDEFGRTCDAGAPPPPDDPPPPPPPDAGTPPDDPPDECGAGMECKPGAVRYCDDPAGEWTKSTCDGTGHWGACIAVPVPPAVVGYGDCSDFDYSPEMCCGEAHICCQDNPGGPWKDFGSGACLEVSCP